MHRRSPVDLRGIRCPHLLLKISAVFVRFASLNGTTHCAWTDNITRRFSPRENTRNLAGANARYKLTTLFAQNGNDAAPQIIESTSRNLVETRVAAPSSRIPFVSRVIRFPTAHGRCKFHVIIEISRLNR